MRASLVILSVSFFGLFAQQSKIDSLSLLTKLVNDSERVNLLNALSEYYLTIEPDVALEFADSANQLAYNLVFRKGMYDSYQNMFKVYKAKFFFRKGLEMAHRQMDVAMEIGNKQLIAESKMNVGDAYAHLFFYSKAFEELTDALKLYTALRDKKSMAIVYSHMGSVNFDAGENELAKKYYRLAIETSDRDPDLVALVNIYMGEVLRKENKFHESITYFEAALAYYEGKGNENFIAQSLLQLGRTYMYLQDYKRAENFYTQAVSIYTKISNLGNRSSCLIDLGAIAIKTRNFESAIDYFTKAIKINKELNFQPQLVRLYTGLTEAYDSLGDLQKAFESVVELSSSKDSLNQNAEREKFDELQVRFEVEQNRQQMEQLQKSKKLNRVIIYLTIFLIALTSFVSILFLKNRRIQQAKNKVLAGIDKQKLEADLKVRELMEFNLRKQVDFKSKELTTFMLTMIQKNELLDSIRTEMGGIKKIADPDTARHLTKLISDINLAYTLDDDWSAFHHYFEQVFGGFLGKLSEAYPDLNSSELKLCALLRLNLRTKQMARILDLSIESIKVARHRLKKKLKLSSEENLLSFFNNFTVNEAVQLQP